MKRGVGDLAEKTTIDVHDRASVARRKAAIDGAVGRKDGNHF